MIETLVSPCRILIVDDSPIFLTAVRRLLAPLEAIEIVGAASSGRDAVRLAEDLQPDLVLMDLVMPEMNGLETTRLLRALPAPPFVVIMTVHDDEAYRGAYRTAATRAGADEFVAKSELNDRLLSLIERLVSGRGSNARTPRGDALA